MNQEIPQAKVVLVVSKQHVKTVKSALERFGKLDRNSKITPEPQRQQQPRGAEGEAHSTPDARFPRLQFDVDIGRYVDPSTIKKTTTESDEERMRIPTLIQYPSTLCAPNEPPDTEEDLKFKYELLEDLVLSYLFKNISISYHLTSSSRTSPVSMSPLHKALSEALNTLPESVLASLHLTPEALVSSFPDGYSVYKPMLLLPHNAFSASPWKTLLATHPIDSSLLHPVWHRMSEAVDTTHVAINSPIPLQTSSPSHPTPASEHSQDNILRSPINLTPLHGDFGPPPTPQTMTSPTPSDFESALWVHTKQNGIYQTWAPLYTMFSRGNIREKTRILHLPPSVSDNNDDDDEVPSAAVDLYAGIGYFAFSYKKSGDGMRNTRIKQVLCWELNPWSVEGLRRGAHMNAWTCTIITTLDDIQAHTNRVSEPDFYVFHMDNQDADPSFNIARFPVRHVNLGLLPSSERAWPVALRMLDRERGGWIHVHENVGMKDIELRTRGLESEFRKLVRDGQNKKMESVRVEHVERVKMYAPGVVHCVFDVFVGV
ncbi:hypothetical protein BDW02DRAFT_486661 [Decorospora gaudefroyi]|uniref:tRNA(Phe) (4-demethylwyosine(37)-C(7)) aminocarboxypropyltransferase n=1 Tax=Decorospora gaudefroyi TaxID=184978 RepID=A0A6A5KLN9_9PLEO|nr:hypothetical protein BDW02DRAFT_486661 [Decorospora gaudefroyi]